MDDTMARAWPFEEVPEGGRNLRTPADFVAHRGAGCEAVVVRIGLHDTQLVLVDAAGAWQRWVYRSTDEAKAAAAPLGIPVHAEEYPEQMRVRINAHRRPAEDFDRGAYPEQGRVGPVIPYAENRLRRRPNRPPRGAGPSS